MTQVNAIRCHQYCVHEIYKKTFTFCGLNKELIGEGYKKFVMYERNQFLAAIVWWRRRDLEEPGSNTDRDITTMRRFLTPWGLDTRGFRINKIFINVIRLSPQMCRRVPDNHLPFVSAETWFFRRITLI